MNDVADWTCEHAREQAESQAGREHHVGLAKRCSLGVAGFGALAAADRLFGTYEDSFWFYPSAAVYALSGRGTLVGLLGVCVAISLWYDGRALSERTCCACCFCFCPDCGRLSNAWHIRNVVVMTLLLALVAMPAPLSKGLSILTEEKCAFVCSSPTWTSCQNCGLYPTRRSGKGRDRDSWRPGLEHECCPSTKDTTEEYSENEDEDTCSQLYCVDEEFEDGCQAMCDCMGGVLEQDQCAPHHGIPALITAFSLAGVAIVASRTARSMNDFLVLDGLEGRPRCLAVAGAMYPPPMPRGSVQVVGAEGSAYFRGFEHSAIPVGAVVGTPVSGPLAAVGPPGSSLVGAPVVVSSKRVSERE